MIHFRWNEITIAEVDPSLLFGARFLISNSRPSADPAAQGRSFTLA